MSQKNPRFGRIKALFSKILPAAPESPLAAAEKMPAPAARKTGFACEDGRITSWEKTPFPSQENSLSVPMRVSGTAVVTFQGAGGGEGWTPEEVEIVRAVTGQLARHLESLLPER